MRKFKNPKASVQIGLVGKYVELHDAYKSISEAFIHAGAQNEVKVNINWLWFTAFVGANLLQSSLTKWCLMDTILEKLGVKN